MRRILMLLAPAMLIACGEAPPERAAVAEPPAPRLHYPAKQPVPARLDLLATGDGGRAVAIPSAWRGEVHFDGGDQGNHCGIKRGDHPEIEPGGSYDVELVCTHAVRLPVDGSRGFRVLEDGREIGSGRVQP
jgi:hypothetical protein